jgi:peroxiredoxin
MLNVGSVAPDFELKNQSGQLVKLSSFHGKQNVVIAFHPLAFTPVCEVQMKAMQAEHARFDKLNAHVLSLSVDAAPAKKAWAEALGGISYDLLADFHPKGKVASDYGVMRADGISERATFIVDKTGKIAWAKQYQIPEQPDREELYAALEKLQ